jgi:hypothetical protein
MRSFGNPSIRRVSHNDEVERLRRVREGSGNEVDTRLQAAPRGFMETITPFHLAFPVNDLEAARHFYGGILGCHEGRSSEHWIDFNFFGHQIVAHLQAGDKTAEKARSIVDDHNVPVPHFGVILEVESWRKLAEKLKAAGVTFVIEPCVRFKGQAGEQMTMFFHDPAGNALEFKAFSDITRLFTLES